MVWQLIVPSISSWVYISFIACTAASQPTLCPAQGYSGLDVIIDGLQDGFCNDPLWYLPDADWSDPRVFVKWDQTAGYKGCQAHGMDV